MKHLIKSVTIKESQYMDEAYDVRFILHDVAGEELIDMISAQAFGDGTPVIIGGQTYFIAMGEPSTTETKGWWDLQKGDAFLGDQPSFSVGTDFEEGYYFLEATFDKDKEGIDKFNYTDYIGIPDNAWIKPAKLIRDIFLSKKGT